MLGFGEVDLQKNKVFNSAKCSVPPPHLRFTFKYAIDATIQYELGKVKELPPVRRIVIKSVGFETCLA